MNPLPADDTLALLTGLLRQSLGSHVEIVAYQIGNRREDYVVVLARLAHPSLDVVVKLAGPRAPYPCPFERTAMLHRLVRDRTTIPMPQVVAVDESYRAWPWRYFIKTHIAGQEWARVRPQLDARELAGAYDQLGAAVAELHGITFPGFGELAADGTVEAGQDGRAALTARARRWIKNARLSNLFLSLLDDHADLFAGVHAATLCHEDLHHHNILFVAQGGHWRLATILDFDKAWAGHHESDLARLELWQDMMGAGFWPAYTAAHPVDSRYAQRRTLYQLLWCLEYAEDTPRHRADTAGLCRALGIAAIEQF